MLESLPQLPNQLGLQPSFHHQVEFDTPLLLCTDNNVRHTRSDNAKLYIADQSYVPVEENGAPRKAPFQKNISEAQVTQNGSEKDCFATITVPIAQNNNENNRVQNFQHLQDAKKTLNGLYKCKPSFQPVNRHHLFSIPSLEHNASKSDHESKPAVSALPSQRKGKRPI